VQLGLHADTKNPNVNPVPIGSPAAENDTLWVEPAVRVAVIVLEPEPPWVTVIVPEFASV
jgi:hypothetical protein